MGVVSINCVNADFGAPHLTDCMCNSPYDILKREGLKVCCTSVPITGAAGAHVLNAFKVTGAVRILDQYAIITEITNIASCTHVYATLYDGTNTVDLTKDGATLSGVGLHTIFFKDEAATSVYTVLNSDQCRMNETSSLKHAGKPFMINAKEGADTYIQFRYTTAGALNFKMDLYFIWQPLNSGTLTLV